MKDQRGHALLYDSIKQNITVNSVVEIGIFNGNTVLAYDDFFPTATITGIEIENNTDDHVWGQCYRERVQPREGNKVRNYYNTDGYSAHTLFAPGSIDLICDAGKDTEWSWWETYSNYQDRISSGGIIIVEGIAYEHREDSDNTEYNLLSMQLAQQLGFTVFDFLPLSEDNGWPGMYYRTVVGIWMHNKTVQQCIAESLTDYLWNNTRLHTEQAAWPKQNVQNYEQLKQLLQQ